MKGFRLKVKPISKIASSADLNGKVPSGANKRTNPDGLSVALDLSQTSVRKKPKLSQELSSEDKIELGEEGSKRAPGAIGSGPNGYTDKVSARGNEKLSYAEKVKLIEEEFALERAARKAQIRADAASSQIPQTSEYEHREETINLIEFNKSLPPPDPDAPRIAPAKTRFPSFESLMPPLKSK